MASKKRVLLCVCGIPRTFKITYKSLFENIIYPNCHKYDFDIALNVDSAGYGIMYNRPDTYKTGVSTYNMSEDQLLKELMECYNVEPAKVRLIKVYNFKPVEPIGALFIVYARVHQILAELHKDSTIAPYDYYMLHRIDSVFTGPLNLDCVNDKLLFITFNVIRPFYFHERDVLDTGFIGAKEPFMKWVWSFISTAYYYSQQTKHYKNLYTLDPIWPNTAVFKNELLSLTEHNPNEILAKKGFVHTAELIMDNLIVNNQPIKSNIITLGNIDMRSSLLYMLTKCLQLINITLSEHLSPPLHTYIVR